MKLIDVQDGGRYLARVSGRIVPVVVIGRQPVSRFGSTRTRLLCRNETTGREIRCTAARLRGKATRLPVGNPPDSFFRPLDAAEEETFRIWARTWHKANPDGEVSPVWHPVVRDEIAKLRG